MRKLENWLKSYMQFTRHLEAPDTFHFWAGVSTIAGALEGKVWIDMGYWKWKPNFFIIFVAPPGVVSKSTTIGIGEELLRQVDGVHFGPNSASWQALTKGFLDSTKRVDINGHDLQMSAMTMSISELGTLLDPRNREMIDVLVDLWDGRPVPWKRSTKAEGESSIHNPWLNIIAATTPSWVAENFPEYAIGGGFTSRTVFVYCDKKRRLAAYPQLDIQEMDWKIKDQLFQDLLMIHEMKGEYHLSPEAFAWGQKWYEKIWANRQPNPSDRMAGYLARKQTHVHKLAMVLSAAKSNNMVIDREDLEAASTLVAALEEDMPKVFSSIADNTQVKYTSAVIMSIRIHGSISHSSLWRELITQMSHREFEEALTGAVRAGIVHVSQVGDEIVYKAKRKEEMN